MSKVSNVMDYYVLCNKLKNVIRTGWKNWDVKRERVESIAEHVCGTQMLAIAMYYEFNYDIDLSKVIKMLAIHEIGEIIIGDLTQFQIDRKEKEKIEHEAVASIFSKLNGAEELTNLLIEFDARETKESQFAYFCDKLECDIQSKLYDEEHCVDLDNQEGNFVMNHPMVKELLDSGCSWSEMWMIYGQKTNHYDENFLLVSNYALTHKLLY